MKDVTITVFISKKGDYRVIVNDDTVTDQNAEGSKGNDSAFTVANSSAAKGKVAEILENLE